MPTGGAHEATKEAKRQRLRHELLHDVTRRRADILGGCDYTTVVAADALLGPCRRWRAA